MAKTVFVDGDFEFNSVTYYVRNFTITETANEVNATDTGTTGNGEEMLGGRVARTFSGERVAIRTDTGIPFNTEYTGTFTDGTSGRTFAGTMIITNREFQHTLDDVMLETFSGRINGTHTITAKT